MRKNENIIKEIDSFQTIPFRLNDLFTIPIFIFIGTVILIILNPEEKSEQTYYQLYYIFILPLIILMTLFLTLGRIFIRWYNLKSLKYILTNQRILFIDKQFNNVVKAFELNEIEIDYTENASNNGSIIIEVLGPKEYVDSLEIASLFFTKRTRGIPLSENKNIMYNISSVRLVFKKIIETQKNIA